MSFRVTVRRDAPGGHPIAWPDAGDAAGQVTEQQLSGKPADVEGHERTGASEAILRQARQAGFQEGEATGRAQAQAEMGPLMERLARTIEELAGVRPKLRQQAEGDLVRLAVAIARRVIRRELTLDPAAIGGLVKAALEQLAAQEVTRVRVHPEHEAAVRVWLAGAGRGANIEVVSDGALARGSAVFETARGTLDASAEAQLVEIERGLTDRLRSSR